MLRYNQVFYFDNVGSMHAPIRQVLKLESLGILPHPLVDYLG